MNLQTSESVHSSLRDGEYAPAHGHEDDHGLDEHESPIRSNAPVIAKRLDVISLGDESALNWFFARGVGIYERSAFGAIIDRLKYGAMGSHPCARCEGEGILNDGGFRVDDTCRRCKGNGSEPGTDKACPQCRGRGREASYQTNVEHGGWCPACRGTGATSIDRRGGKPTACGSCPGTRSARKCKNCGTCKVCLAAKACRNCRNCLGTGTEPVSVHPSGIDGASGREGADDSALTKFALTSRRLQRVRAKSPALFMALVAYYGDVGTRWGLTNRGRIFALYHLTGPGKKLSRQAISDKERASLPEAQRADDLTMPERIGVRADLDRDQPKRERTALLDTAGAHAQELYQRAAVAWNEANEGTPKRVTRSLVKRATKLGLVSLANALADQGGAK